MGESDGELKMTTVVLILGILLGTGSLAYGYYAAGMTDSSLLFILLGGIWLLAHWRKLYWASSIMFLLILISASYGIWNQYNSPWMLLGALGGLLGWDLSDFARRLSYAARSDDTTGMERRHLTRVGIVAAIGFGLAFLSLIIRINRLAFEVAVALIFLAVIGLARLVTRLRKY
jgi:hypothetical protein